MTEFVSNPIERIVELSASSERKHAAVAYVTTNHADFNEGDLLVCDASDRSIIAKMTSRDLLKELVERKVAVYSCEFLHAKMIVFDHQEVFVGSANLSNFAAQRVEVGIWTDDAQTVAASEKFIGGIISVSEKVDEEFLRSISKLKLAKTKPPTAPAKLKKLRSKVTTGELEVSYWFFKGTQELSKKSQAVADELKSEWVEGVDEPTADDFEEVPDDENPIEFAGLRHYNDRWKSTVAVGDKVFWCYEDDDWGWIVLPARTVVSTAIDGKSVIAGTEGLYWDDYNSIRLDLFVERIEMRKNASLS